MDFILSFIKGITLKQWGWGLLIALAFVGFASIVLSFRSCGNEARVIVGTLVDSQVKGDKLLADSVHKLLESHKAVLAEQAKLEKELVGLRQAYDEELRSLEAKIAKKDQAIKEEFAQRLAERSKQLRDNYEKTLSDPAAARDSFINSLHLWDDLWSPGAGETPAGP